MIIKILILILIIQYWNYFKIEIEQNDLYDFDFSFRSSNLPDFSRDVKMLATLNEDDDSGNRLLDAARGLIGAFSDLLRAAEPLNNEVSY